MKKVISFLLVLVIALSLCACGSSSGDMRASYSPAAAPAYEDGYWEMPAEEAVEYEAAGFAVNGAAAYTKDSDSISSTTSETPTENPDKIIYSSDVTVETTDFEGSLNDLDELIAEYGGWVESSSVNGANFYNRSRGYVSNRSANYTIRIPSNRFDALMNSLSTLGNVPYTHTYTENVTTQYYDAQARLKAYQTQETRLLEMMEVAESVEDIILLEDRLTELRYQIESIQSNLNNWDRRVSYSTVYLSLQEVQEYTPEVETKLTYGQKLGRALKDGLSSVADFFKDFFLWFVEALPTLLIIAAVITLIVVLVNKSSKKRKIKKQQKIAAQMAAQQTKAENMNSGKNE